MGQGGSQRPGEDLKRCPGQEQSELATRNYFKFGVEGVEVG